MSIGKKIAACVCATAFGCAAAMPASAARAAVGTDAPVPLHATVVSAASPDILSVVMPAQLPLSIYLDAAGNVDYGAGKTHPVTAAVKNLAASSGPVRVTFDSVADPQGLLEQLELGLNGVNLATASPGIGLVDAIQPGGEAPLTLAPSPRSGVGKPALNDAYNLSVVVKASRIATPQVD